MSTKVRAVSFAIEREIRHGLGALANYESVGDDSKILIDARANLRASRIDLWSSDRQETTSPGAGSN